MKTYAATGCVAAGAGEATIGSEAGNADPASRVIVFVGGVGDRSSDPVAVAATALTDQNGAPTSAGEKVIASKLEGAIQKAL